MIVCQIGSWNASSADVSRRRFQLDYSPLSTTSPALTGQHVSMGRLIAVVALVIVFPPLSVIIRHPPIPPSYNKCLLYQWQFKAWNLSVAFYATLGSSNHITIIQRCS